MAQKEKTGNQDISHDFKKFIIPISQKYIQELRTIDKFVLIIYMYNRASASRLIKK